MFDKHFATLFVLNLGTSFLHGSTIGIELVDEFRKQIQLIVEYTINVCESADTAFSRVHKQLTEMGNILTQIDKRISSFEKVSKIKQYEYRVINYTNILKK